MPSLPATLTTPDGIELRLRGWPSDGRAHGSTLLVHGLGEHVDRLERIAAHLQRGGWHVVGYDHRGHGASGGPRGVIARDDDLLRDLAQVVDAVRTAHAGPLLLFGDSMGGAVAARFVAESIGPEAQAASWRRDIDGLLLASPAFAADLNPWQRALLAVLGRLAPGVAAPSGLDVDALSRDPATVAAYRLDPRVHDRICARLARFIIDAGAKVRACAGEWRTPTLLLWAGADRIVAPRGSAEFAAAAPSRWVTARCFDGLAHEIFNEPERAQVFAALDGWLAAYTAALPSTASRPR